MIRPKTIRLKVTTPTKLKNIMKPNLPKSYKTEAWPKVQKTESKRLQDRI